MNVSCARSIGSATGWRPTVPQQMAHSGREEVAQINREFTEHKARQKGRILMVRKFLTAFSCPTCGAPSGPTEELRQYRPRCRRHPAKTPAPSVTSRRCSARSAGARAELPLGRWWPRHVPVAFGCFSCWRRSAGLAVCCILGSGSEYEMRDLRSRNR